MYRFFYHSISVIKKWIYFLYYLIIIFQITKLCLLSFAYFGTVAIHNTCCSVRVTQQLTSVTRETGLSTSPNHLSWYSLTEFFLNFVRKYRALSTMILKFLLYFLLGRTRCILSVREKMWQLFGDPFMWLCATSKKKKFSKLLLVFHIFVHLKARSMECAKCESNSIKMASLPNLLASFFSLSNLLTNAAQNASHSHITCCQKFAHFFAIVMSVYFSWKAIRWYSAT